MAVESKRALKEIVNDWILDYTYACIWDQFSEKHAVDDAVARDFIQGVFLWMEDRMNPEQELKMMLIQLMCRLSDGQEMRVQYENMTAEAAMTTVLENGLSLYGNIQEHLHVQGYFDLQPLEEAIIRTAVHVPVKEGDLEMAKSVLERLSRKYDTQDSDKVDHHKLRTELSSLKQPEPNFYEDFLAECVELLKPVTATFKQPVLFEFAEKVHSRMDKMRSHQERTFAERLPSQLKRQWNANEMRRIAQRFNFGAVSSLDLSESERTEYVGKVVKLKKNKVSVISRLSKSLSAEDEPQSNRDPVYPPDSPRIPVQGTSNGTTPSRTPLKRRYTSPRSRRHRDLEDEATPNPSGDEDTYSPTKKVPQPRSGSSPYSLDCNEQRPFQMRRCEGRENRHEPKNTSLEDRLPSSSPGPAPIPRLPPQQKMRASLVPWELKSPPRIRRPWTDKEAELLARGILKYGEGRWAAIREAYPLDRTNVNLKDKWRQLKSIGMAEVYLSRCNTEGV